MTSHGGQLTANRQPRPILRQSDRYRHLAQVALGLGKLGAPTVTPMTPVAKLGAELHQQRLSPIGPRPMPDRIERDTLVDTIIVKPWAPTTTERMPRATCEPPTTNAERRPITRPRPNPVRKKLRIRRALIPQLDAANIPTAGLALHQLDRGATR